MAALPLVLLTNDDGVRSPLLEALAAAAGALGEVVVVAPDRDQSAVSHMISLYAPLRAEVLRPGWWSVSGTPTDCAYLGIVELLGRRPDLVISGINSGPNLSYDVHYSGTVAAAIEGTLMGVPSIAVSLADAKRGDGFIAARFAVGLARQVLARGLPRGVTLNVNVPGGVPTQYQRTFLGRRGYAHSVERRLDPRGRPYFWIGGPPTRADRVLGSDCTAVDDGLISVTPLWVDMTAAGAAGIEGTIDDFAPVAPIEPPRDDLVGEG